MSEKQEFVTVDREYLMELDQKAKDSEYFRGRVDGLEYVVRRLLRQQVYGYLREDKSVRKE